MMEQDYVVEMVEIESLRPHPQNYRSHPDDQIEQIAESIREHGFYKNIVVAREGTILAGHGAVLASRKVGLAKVPVKRFDIDPFSTKAMKIVVGDNELFRLAENDDRKLTEILKRIADSGDANGDIAAALLGTGFDPMQLAALLMVTRPESEIKDKNAAAHYVGMPEYESAEEPIKLVISFDNEADRQALLDLINVKTINRKSIGVGVTTWSVRWPDRGRRDLISLRFDEEETTDMPL